MYFKQIRELTTVLSSSMRTHNDWLRRFATFRDICLKQKLNLLRRFVFCFCYQRVLVKSINHSFFVFTYSIHSCVYTGNKNLLSQPLMQVVGITKTNCVDNKRTINYNGSKKGDFFFFKQRTCNTISF